MTIPRCATVCHSALVTQGPDCDAGVLPRSLDVIFSSIDEKVFPGTSIKPHRCREFTRLTAEQQAEEASFKRSLLRQLKEVTCSDVVLLRFKLLIRAVLHCDLQPSCCPAGLLNIYV